MRLITDRQVPLRAAVAIVASAAMLGSLAGFAWAGLERCAAPLLALLLR